MADLDPAGPILSRLFTLDSNAVIETVDGAGLGVDWTLTEKQNYSNNTRKREFRPRVSTALNALTPADRLRVLGLLASRLEQRGQGVKEGLNAIGWASRGDVLQERSDDSVTSADAELFSTSDAKTLNSGKTPRTRKAFILTALACEFNAVSAHLDGIREEVHASGSLYEVGLYAGDTGTWEVAIVQAGMGNPGAALEGERGINQFDPDVVLMVGIAGGLKDVEIGDVVASDKVYYYEAGKDTNKGLMLRPDVGQSSHALVHRARAIARKSSWQQTIRGAAPQHRPSAYVGPIAAGELVIGGTRAAAYQLVREKMSDALAVEMEGYGVMRAAHANEARAIIVRGISDTINKKAEADAEGWQDVASRHAAAFAFQVLGQMPDNDRRPDEGQEMSASVKTDESSRKTAAQALLAQAAKMMHRLLADTGVDLDRLQNDADEWQRDVEAEFSSLPWIREADKHDFSVITPWVPRRLGGINPRHEQIREDVMERIARLRAIARRLEDPTSAALVPAVTAVLVEPSVLPQPDVRPCLRLREPGAIHTDQVTFFEHQTGKPLWTGNFVHVRFVNEPPSPEPSAVASGIAAKITYSHRGQVLKIVDGRWGDLDQPGPLIAAAKSTYHLLRADFNIGDEHNLDIVFKLIDEDACYIFNNDSYLFAPTFKKPDYRLPVGTYDVNVRLRGVRVDESFTFQFENPRGRATTSSSDLNI